MEEHAVKCIGYSVLASILTVGMSASQEKAVCPYLVQPVDDHTFETFLGFFATDKNLPFSPEVFETVKEGGIRREHISYQSTPAERIFAYFYRPVVIGAEKQPAIIFIHGGVPQGKDGRGARRIPQALTRDGWNVLAFDLKHFGERNDGLMTTFTEKDKHDKLYNQPSVYLEWVTQTVKDVSRSIDFLLKERNVDPQRIGLVGFSRGAMVATIAGGAERRLGAVVNLYGGHFDALEREHLPAACPANYVGRISPRPLFAINGTRDTDMIEETSVAPLYRLAKEPKTIRWVDGGHAAMTDEDMAVMLKWLRDNLK
jgi:dienelactone hydrolase